MKASFKIANPASLCTAVTEIFNNLPAADVPHVIEVREWKANRSAVQNRLYWRFLTDFQETDVNEHAGTTKEDWHDRFKRLCLSKIYERDNEQYAATMAALREVYRHGLHNESKAMVDHVMRETSTTSATVEQFTEYLKFIERYAHERGIRLATDVDYYSEAMGL